MITLPKFRAKKIDSDEYVEGFLKNCTDTGLDVFWIQDNDFIDYRIDIDTLSINFPNKAEELQNRKCENCKHYSTGKQPDGFEWHKCEYAFECKTCFNDYFEREE